MVLTCTTQKQQQSRLYLALLSLSRCFVALDKLGLITQNNQQLASNWESPSSAIKAEDKNKFPSNFQFTDLLYSVYNCEDVNVDDSDNWKEGRIDSQLPTGQNWCHSRVSQKERLSTLRLRSCRCGCTLICSAPFDFINQ